MARSAGPAASGIEYPGAGKATSPEMLTLRCELKPEAGYSHACQFALLETGQPSVMVGGLIVRIYASCQ